MDRIEIEDIITEVRELRHSGKTANELTEKLLSCIERLACEFHSYQKDHP